MKRIFSAMLALACVACFVSQSEARLVTRTVPFEFVRGQVISDSSLISSVQLTTIGLIDTSAVIDLRHAAFNSPVNLSNSAIADTNGNFALRLIFTCVLDPNTNLTNADSVRGSVQGTYDGKVWFAIYTDPALGVSMSGVTVPGNVTYTFNEQMPTSSLISGIGAKNRSFVAASGSWKGLAAVRFIRLLTGVHDMSMFWQLTAQYVVPDNAPIDGTN